MRGYVQGVRWVAVTAWRDARRARKALLAAGAAMVFGVAALAAVLGFTQAVRRTMDERALLLLGADLTVRSNQPFSSRAEAFFQSLGGAQAREVRLTSMALFEGGGTRLVQVRAQEDGFPFYGQMETVPADAETALQAGAAPVALLDDALAAQFGVGAGGTVKLGRQTFRVAGVVKAVPGESGFSMVFAPRVYVPLRYLEGTGLLGRGSLSTHVRHFRLETGVPEARLREARDGLFAQERIRYETVAMRKKDLGRTLENLYRFLGVAALVALVLGGVGIAGAAQAYLREKHDSVAVLRCLGATSRRAVAVYVAQIAVVALLGGLAGAFLGIALQRVLPVVVGAWLPFPVTSMWSWGAFLLAAGVGWGVGLAFALLPLAPLRKVRPVAALRSGVERVRRGPDGLQVLIGLGIALGGAGLCAALAENPAHGLALAAGVAVALLVLTVLAWVLRRAVRAVAPLVRAYTVRQGLANLDRPGNRTLFLSVTLGLGAALVYTLFLLQGMLLGQADLREREGEPNLLFFDIQPDQREGLAEILREHGLAVMEEAAVVTMRLASVKGRSVAELRADPETTIPEWVLNREWRSTWRGFLKGTERLSDGSFTARVEAGLEPVPVSVERGIARDLGVGLGDELVYDVQGVPVRVRVDSLREVDWHRLRPNFFVVFPEGAIDEAPTWFIAVTRAEVRKAADVQRAVVARYPNISAIDLGQVLDVVRGLLDRISFATRFMASFTILTGLVVLSGAMAAGRVQRVRENALLRTLGATSRQVRRIHAVEFALVGALAGVAAVLLAVPSAWALGRWVFHLPLGVPWWSVPAVVGGTAALTLVTGLAQSWRTASAPPLKVLREE